MTSPFDALSSALDAYRAEVLVAVRTRGIVIAHNGGEMLGWKRGVQGPRTLADMFAATDVDRIEAIMYNKLRAQRVTVPGSVLALRTGGVVPVTVDVLDETNSRLRAWVLRLHPAPTDPGYDLIHDPIVAEMSRAPKVADRFEAISQAVPFGILAGKDKDLAGYANPAARELLWRTQEELQEQGWLSSVLEENQAEVASALNRVQASGIATVVEFQVAYAGRRRWLRARLSAEISTGGHIDGWVAVFNDITNERSTAEEMARRATHDVLTGLPNRALFDDRLSVALARSERSKSSLTVMFIDLDDFKSINDIHGHRAGDIVLNTVAQSITKVIRSSDTAARIGGDEFVVLTEGATPNEAEEVAKRITESISRPMPVEEVTLVIKASVGIAWSGSATGTDRSNLLDRADAAMYEAKRNRSGHHLDLGDPDLSRRSEPPG